MISSILKRGLYEATKIMKCNRSSNTEIDSLIKYFLFFEKYLITAASK